MRLIPDSPERGENCRKFEYFASGSSMRSRAGHCERTAVMTPAETILEDEKRGDSLAAERKHRDVLENLAESAHGIASRAFGELELLSAAVIITAEAAAGLTSDLRGSSERTRSWSSVSSGASAPAKSLRPASKKVRHPSMPAPSSTPPSGTRVWIIGDHYAEMTTALLAIGVAAANVRFWDVDRSSYSPELLK